MSESDFNDDVEVADEPEKSVSMHNSTQSGDLHPPLANVVADPALILEAKRTTRIDVAQTGFNPALSRMPAIETQTVSLNTVLDFVPS